jgi:hypothetical protein
MHNDAGCLINLNIVINIDSQTMLVYYKNVVERQFKISTSRNGIGNVIDSYKTPLGKHSICEKIGEFAPIYTIFKSRQNTGNVCKTLNMPINDNEDLILTRILRLQGEEPGLNYGYTIDSKCIDSYDRCIYIHGTNREDLLSIPASNGCIRMANLDIIELFAKVNIGTIVDIQSSSSTLADKTYIIG